MAKDKKYQVDSSDPLSNAHKQATRRRVLKGCLAGGAVAAMNGVASYALAGTTQSGSPLDLPTSIKAAGDAIRAGKYSCEELTKAYLAGIKELQPKLNAFITITDEIALRQSRHMDRELRAGRDHGPLHGIPLVYKDLYDTKGVRTTVGSAFFRNRIPNRNATVIERLTQAGAVMLGKTNMNEFAAGITGTNEAYGDIHNPWNLERSPGGSSSGTAAAVAAGLCLGGTGSDTGGSIRVPCSWDNLTGVRPTFGRVSLSGVFPRAYSLDCGGPIARSAVDAALLLNAMAGYDSTYKYSIHAPRENFTKKMGSPIRGLRIGVIKNYSYRDVDAGVVKAVENAVLALEKQGATIVEVDIPYLAKPLDFSSLFTILLYEFNQILGDRFRAAPDKSLFGSIVHSDIAKGEKITRSDYEKALLDRKQQIQQFKAGFESADVFVTPGMPTVAPPLAPSGEAYLRGRQFTLPISWVGLPTVSVPCGFAEDDLPVGMQLIGNAMQEATLLQIAEVYESKHPYYSQQPPIHSSISF